MGLRDPYSNTPRSMCSGRLLLVIATIIVLLIAAFLILRPNPSGAGRQESRPAAPSSH